MLRTALRWLLTIGMVLAGINHFIDPATYVAMMPSALPWHLELVYASGVFEILGGLGLIQLVESDASPLRWVCGEDAVERVEQKARLLLAQVDAHRELSSSLAHDDAHVAA